MKKTAFLRRTKKFFLISLLILSVFLCLSLPALARKDYALSVIKLEGVRNDLVGHIKKGDPVIEAATKKELGRVYGIKTEPHLKEVFSQTEKKLVLREYEGYSDLFLTLSASAKTESGDLMQNGYPIKIGKSLSLRLPTFCGVGYCVSISFESENGE